MNRRTFMKGTVIAASTPALAAAPALQATIGPLIAHYAHVRTSIARLEGGSDDAELDGLLVVEDDLNERILSFRCQTLDDVRMKVAHLDRVYADRLSGETAQRVMQSLIS
ncbi:hypothetical protein U8C36_06725 [Sinorhizobium medicae]|uniref:hypothetical protein n=1 Tax=Sinorhizobium medicae TaxID=110321 RepID=UPI002AF6B53C|nr:hypothetical protein [Sinorhizobium medicae]WQO53302.1 hypothetical protein U8C36_06725 [Sinorhizobium medicae]WQO73998.1 hypothetical protein U8C31_06855 [Sinorhizobium medicae]